MLSFRFGFLCHHAGEDPVESIDWKKARRGWLARRYGDFQIHLHPETRIAAHMRAEGIVLILGDAYLQSGGEAEPGDLAALVAAMDWRDPWPLLDRIGGRHAILFLSGHNLRAAHDAFGARSLFYAPGRNAVASHAGLLARAYDLAPDPAVAAFMRLAEYQARSVNYLPGDITPFTGVYALVPNNHLDDGKTFRYWPRQERRATTRDEFLAAAASYFRDFVPFIRENYIPIFGITGGIDSRAVFAAFDRDFLGVTWTHYFPRSERPIVLDVLSHLSIAHRFMNPRDHKPGRIARASGQGGGGLRPGHPLSEAMAAAFPHEGHAFIRGYGGEILRGFPAYQDILPDLSVESMTTSYSSSIRKCQPSPEYRALCEGWFAEFRQRANYAGLEAFGYKPMDYFYWEHRMGMWAASMLNEMDPALLALVGFNSRPLYVAAFGLADEIRLSKQLLVSIIEIYDPALAAIPHAGNKNAHPERRKKKLPVAPEAIPRKGLWSTLRQYI